MGHAAELLCDGAVNRRMAVSMDVGPDGRVSIQVFATLLITKDAAFATDERQGLMVLRAPGLHWGEGMPEMLLVGRAEVGWAERHGPFIAQDSSGSRKKRRAGCVEGGCFSAQCSSPCARPPH